MQLQSVLAVGVFSTLLCWADSASGPSKSPTAACGVPVLSKMSGELISHTTYAKCEFPPNFKCEWNLVSIATNPLAKFEFSFAAYEMPRDNLPCADTHLKFYSNGTLDNTLCHGREIPKVFKSSGNHVKIVFKTTDDAKGLTAKGFHLKWRFVRECLPSDYICNNKECIAKEFRCDGGTGIALGDCADGSDEANCPKLSACPTPGDMMCKHKLRCYTKDQECDGHSDCRDGSDESKCADVVCDASKGLARCNHKKRCYNIKDQECNGVKDCRDNTDEEKCVEKTCTKDEFRCNHKFACVPKNYKCDGIVDCNDKSDELGCTKQTCTADQISCDNGYRCIDKKAKQCDGTNDCRDGSDESSAFCKVLTKCSNAGEVLCKHKYACVSVAKICDGKVDCTDGSDENNCKKPGFSCTANQLTCRTAQCVDNSKRCDMVSDCFDNLDEENCLYSTGQGPPCGVNHIWCAKAKKCIRSTMACNGVSDCGAGDNSDEENCPANPADACDAGKFHKCDNSQYIKKDKVCDGHSQCADGSDEKNCSSG